MGSFLIKGQWISVSYLRKRPTYTQIISKIEEIPLQTIRVRLKSMYSWQKEKIFICNKDDDVIFISFFDFFSMTPCILEVKQVRTNVDGNYFSYFWKRNSPRLMLYVFVNIGKGTQSSCKVL